MRSPKAKRKLDRMRKVFFLLVAVSGMILIGRHFDLGKQDWAAWVQAVGSIVAITVGFVLADKQSQLAALQLERERLVTDHEQAGGVLAVATLVENYLKPALKEMSDRGSVRGYLEASADYVDFDGAKRAIDTVPIFQLRSSDAIQGVLLLGACLNRVRHMTDFGQNDPTFANHDYYEFKAAAEEALVDLEKAMEHIIGLASQCYGRLLDHDDLHGHAG